ncbi:hypothetical protein V2G26_010670 [Clonostachys chloroleuca]
MPSSEDVEDTKKTVPVHEHDFDANNGVLVSGELEIDRQYGRTKRGLSPRHVQLMTIGGSIGTGLFVGIGGSLSRAGPLSLFLGYIIWGVFFIWPCMLSVAEMCAYLPIRGSIFELAGRYVDPALGFALGWLYFFAGVMLVCAEYSAVATVMGFWLPDVNPAAWIAMSMVVCVLLNVVAVKYYGEAEFVMASLKILLLIGLVLLTIVTMCGGNPKGDRYGFTHWTNGQAMLSYYAPGALGRFLAWWKVVLYAAFTIAGPDMIAISAGEMQNPRRTIPRVAKLVFWRLVGFYVVGVVAVGTICSASDPRLLGALKDGSVGSAASPWVIGIQNLGIEGLPSLINFLILSSGLSCGNAYLYSSSRTLYGLARDGHAPKFLQRCTKTGVPIWAVTVVSTISLITFLSASNAAIEVFFWFVDLTTTALVLTYSLMLVTFLGWYRAKKAQNLPNSELHYIAPLNPYAASVALGMGITAIIFIGFDTFQPFKVQSFVTSYFAVPYALVFFVGGKIFKKTKFVDPAAADLISGKREVDAECREWEEGGIEENWKRELAAMSFWKRCWERIW